MSARTKKRLQELNVATSDQNNGSKSEQDLPKTKPRRTDRPSTGGVQRRSMIQRQDNPIGLAAAGKQRVVQTRFHSPARIRPWSGHNRDYKLLSVARCNDLIEGFKRVGHQELPAVVRKCENDPDFDYEFIYGARRHWTASYLGWDLLIEVRDVNDRQAFILQDMENRDREDVSDYERACDYQAALSQHFNNNQTEMAKFLQIDKSNFNRLLDLTSLPKAIITAYADIRDLKTHHGIVYKKLLSDTSVRKRVLDRARATTLNPQPGKQVLSELKSAASSKPASGQRSSKQFGSLVLTRRTSGKLAIDCKLPPTLDEKALNAIRADFESLLADIAKKTA